MRMKILEFEKKSGLIKYERKKIISNLIVE